MNSFRYILFYKPFQVLSQFSPEGEKKTLANYLKGIEKNIYPLGRLDYDSEGLLVLSNDSSLNQKLLNPKKEHQKTYLVQVEGTPTEQDLQRLAQGVEISVNGKKHQTLPAKVEIVEPPENLAERHPPIRFRQSIPTSWITIKIGEGKNRQVRKMTASIGFPTLRLIRIAIGKIKIDELKPGMFRDLNEAEIKLLFEK